MADFIRLVFEALETNPFRSTPIKQEIDPRNPRAQKQENASPIPKTETHPIWKPGTFLKHSNNNENEEASSCLSPTGFP